MQSTIGEFLLSFWCKGLIGKCRGCRPLYNDEAPVRPDVTGVAGSCGFVEGDGKFFAIARLDRAFDLDDRRQHERTQLQPRCVLTRLSENGKSIAVLGGRAGARDAAVTFAMQHGQMADAAVPIIFAIG